LGGQYEEKGGIEDDRIFLWNSILFTILRVDLREKWEQLPQNKCPNKDVDSFINFL